MTTTSMASSFKMELPEAAHCFLATQSSLAGAGVNGAFTLTGLASTANVAVGMAAAGTNVAAGAIVASIDSATQVTVSKAHTGTVTTGTISFTGDVFNMLLIKASATGTYDSTLTNVGTPGSGSPSTTNVGTDEVTGTGYTTLGFALTNINPALTTTTAYWGFSVNPSWTTVTITVISGVIFNKNTRVGASTYALGANRVVANFDFGGTQTMTAATFTVVQPTLNSSTGLLRIS